MNVAMRLAEMDSIADGSESPFCFDTQDAYTFDSD